MRLRIALALLLLAAAARADFRELQGVPVDPSITVNLKTVVDQTLKENPKLTADSIAITLVDLTKPTTISRGDYHGDASFYPASVIKLFFMAETFHQRKENEPDMPRALKEMIVMSDNDATAFVVDTISDTCSGPELQGRALEKFIDKRRVVNRWTASMGYDISAMMKPWSFGPFGRDMQALGANRENRNRATANAFAALMLWIVRGRAVSPQASQAMMALLERPLNPQRKDENQVKEFAGEALPPEAKLWSKAGWTNEVRHDAAYIELPNGRKFILVILTKDQADDVKLLPAMARKVLTVLTPPEMTPPPH